MGVNSAWLPVHMAKVITALIFPVRTVRGQLIQNGLIFQLSENQVIVMYGFLTTGMICQIR